MQVADAVIFSTNTELMKQLVETLKMKKVTNIVQSKTAKTALDGATRFAKSLLIID